MGWEFTPVIFIVIKKCCLKQIMWHIKFNIWKVLWFRTSSLIAISQLRIATMPAFTKVKTSLLTSAVTRGCNEQDRPFITMFLHTRISQSPPSPPALSLTVLSGRYSSYEMWILWECTKFTCNTHSTFYNIVKLVTIVQQIMTAKAFQKLERKGSYTSVIQPPPSCATNNKPKRDI